MTVDVVSDKATEVSHNNEEETEVCSSEQCGNEENFYRGYEENYDIPNPIYLEWPT